ncbi:MAG: hypothetical protein IJB94_02880 [Clostridia bacterium]|nr:hypothetical protein [Clostridia bacterium]
MENIGSRICFSTIFAGRLLALLFAILGFPAQFLGSLGFPSTLYLLLALAWGGVHRYYFIGGLVILALLLLCALTTTILMWFKKPKLTLWITITQVFVVIETSIALLFTFSGILYMLIVLLDIVCLYCLATIKGKHDLSDTKLIDSANIDTYTK